MINLERIKKSILKGWTIEKIIENFDWDEFEDMVVEVFVSNDFLVKKNFRFRTEKRYEMDIIAVRFNKVFCIDCKEWGRGRNKRHGLRSAARKQIERTEKFRRFLKNNLKVKKMFNVKLNYRFIPLIVTWLQEDILQENGCLVIPVWILNNFLLDMDNYVL